MIGLAAAAVLGLPMSGDAILARAKTVFHAHVRPPYVSYTLERRDFAFGELDLENTYTDKVWCRAADRSAMLRRMWHGTAVGEPRSETIAFDERVDPGPPTADLFERSLFGAAPPAPAPQQSQAPLIGNVTTRVELDYRVTRATRDGDDIDLLLEPKRDAARNRIDELWVDGDTFEVTRVRVRDHLFFGLSPTPMPEELVVRFARVDGVPVIASIDGQTENGAFAVEYRFSDLRFVDDLPAWYFSPASYRSHRSEAPQ
jgi:hypothetical protein